MSFTHLLLTLLLVCVWGFNYVVIKIGLDGMPPIFLACARFFCTCFPAIFFVKRPELPFKKLALYSFVTFVFQFALFFIGMNLGVTPGLASLLMQIQVFFSVLLAILLFNEKISPMQIVGALISFSGVAYVGINVGGTTPFSGTFSGFFSVIAAALFWAMGSAISKSLGKTNILSLIVWCSMIAWPPLLLFSLLFEGHDVILQSLKALSVSSMASIFYLSYLATIFGYGLWNWLLQRQPISYVVPFTMLIPIIAMFSSALVLNEPLQSWKIIASCLVMGGLSINFLSPHLHRLKGFFLLLLKQVKQ